MDYVGILIGSLLGAVIGFLFLKLKGNSTSNETKQQYDEVSQLLNNEKTTSQILRAENTSLKERFSKEEAKISELSSQLLASEKELSEWKQKYIHSKEQIDKQESELENLQERFTKDFQVIANKILEEKSSKFTETNKENIDNLLTPLKERLNEFQKKVEENQISGEKRTAALSAQLKILHDLNKEITDETKNLTQALKGDSKLQGNWGEMLLESILAKAGLQEDIHYKKEQNFKNEEGNNQRLDFIINLPDRKTIILDSKVSLTAYSNYFNSEDDEEQKTFIKRHLESIYAHMKTLSEKKYQNLYEINPPDYVLMFIANEPALSLALKEDQQLFEKALEKNIVLVSSTTLLATLRTISFIWKQDQQSKNAEEIARQAASLYDKFVNFSNDLIKLGGQLQTANKTYSEAMKKLSEGKDNLVRKTERLKELGASSVKSIDQRLLDRSGD